MKMHIVAVRDIVANVFGQPMFVGTLGGAIRSFGDQCTNTTDASNVLATHPEDFELYQLGEYNDENARFELLAEPKQIAIGASYKKH